MGTPLPIAPAAPHAEADTPRRRALLMMLAAPVCWSLGGLLVRALSITNAWEIVFWRSLAMVLFVAGALLAMHGRAMPRAVRDVGLPGLLSGALLAGTFFFFIGSLTRTTVASTFVLMSLSPFLAAIASRMFLREPVPLRTWITMAIAFAGVMIMFSDALDAGRWTGNLLALGVSVCFALNLVTLRRFRASADMLPAVMIAGLLSLGPAFALAGPFAATARDLLVLAFAGCVQLGAGCLLMTAASRHLSPTEIGLLALLEPILGPVWVWALLGERPSTLALAGAIVVLAAVLADQAFAAWSAAARRHGRTSRLRTTTAIRRPHAP